MSQALTAPPGAGNGAGPMDDTDIGDLAQGDQDDVILTIARDPNGGYLVYTGDEPDEGDQDLDQGASDQDVAALGGAPPPGGPPGGPPGAGGPPGPGGGGPAPQHADGIGQALQMAMEILQDDEQNQGGMSAEDQFQAGFNGGGGPPGGMPGGVPGGGPGAFPGGRGPGRVPPRPQQTAGRRAR